jgi:hypothetical protein
MNDGTEAQHAEALASWFEIQYPHLILLFHHSPNEGKRSWRFGRSLKRMGMRRGWPDYNLALPRGEYHGLYIELKRPSAFSKRQPAHQSEVLKKLSSMGYYCTYAFGFDDARLRIDKYINNTVSVPTAILE